MSHLYVIQFSTGVVKVGRSIDPKGRIERHGEAAACFGVSIDRSAAFACIGNTEQSERMLIEWCKNVGNGVHAIAGNEWFCPLLSYEATCAMAEEIASTEVAARAVNASSEAIRHAAFVLRGQAELARVLGYSDRRNVSPYFRDGGPALPYEHCCAIEAATARAGEVVRVEELRPDVKWHRVKDKSWPIAEGRPLADFAGASV